MQHQPNDECKISHFEHAKHMKESMDDRSIHYYEEVLRLMNEIVALMKENNMALKEHSKTVEQLNERVRKIGINTSSI